MWFMEVGIQHGSWMGIQHSSWMVVVGTRHQSLMGAGPSVEVVLGPGCHLLTVVLGPHGCRWWLLPPLVDGGRGRSLRRLVHRKGEACDVWTEQVREPHLNNTHTHFKTLTHLHPLYMPGASSSGFSRY